MQSGTTAEMVFSIPELIAFVSRHVTLRPGDVILTGTPDGVGIGRNPRVYMKPGSSLTTRIWAASPTRSSTARIASDEKARSKKWLALNE